jgi:hypothetical protein
VAANVTGYNFQFNADSGFGALKPITADQFDLAFEHYFNESSSFTFDAVLQEAERQHRLRRVPALVHQQRRRPRTSWCAARATARAAAS